MLQRKNIKYMIKEMKNPVKRLKIKLTKHSESKAKRQRENRRKKDKGFKESVQETPNPNKRNSRISEQKRLGGRNNFFFEDNFSELKESPD